MGDPQRLLASARAGGLARALLESEGPAAGPTREQIEAVWGGLAARTAAVPADPRPRRGQRAAGAASVAGPIAAVGGVALAAAIALAVTLHGRSGAPAATAPTEQPPAPAAPTPAAQAPAAPASTGPAAPAPTAPAAPPPGSAPLAASRPPTAVPRPVQPDLASSLRAESELLLRARASLRAGDCVAALAQAERLKARFPAGALAQEREVVAIQALACKGRDAEASARAAAFLQEHPASPHADAVRALLK